MTLGRVRVERGDGQRTVLLLSDEVVLGFDAGLEGVEVLALVLLHVGGDALQDVVGGGGAAARAALGAAGLRHHVGVLVHHLVFLGDSGKRRYTVTCVRATDGERRGSTRTCTMARRCWRRCSIRASSSISSPSKSSNLHV